MRPRLLVSLSSFASFAAVALSSGSALAHEAPAEPLPAPNEPPPPTSPPPEESGTNESEGRATGARPAPLPEPEVPSEGRRLVSWYNSGFQWNLSPGVVFASGKAGLALGVRFGYGIDAGPVIVVPAVRLSGIFLDPNVYVGLPVLKLVVPIDRVAPFVEGGVGVGHVGGDAAKTGVALQGGGGLMIHVSAAFAFGAEAGYQVITGTGFKGFTVGPILAIGF